MIAYLLLFLLGLKADAGALFWVFWSCGLLTDIISDLADKIHKD